MTLIPMKLSYHADLLTIHSRHTIELAPLMCYDHCINTGSRKAERDAQSDPNNLIRIVPAEGCAASTKNTLPAEGVF